MNANPPFRSHFPVTAKWAFFDHAAVAPLPDVAVQALHDYADSLAGNGIAAVGHWVNRLRDVRRLAAQLINAPDPTDVCFIPNTTFGIGLVAEGFPWQPGDNLVTAAEEYPSNLYPWMNLRDRGVEVRRVASQGNRIAVDDLRAAVDDRTRLLTISAVEFGSGFRNDLALLAQLCKEKQIFYFVDAIQALGVLPFNVQSLGVDALSADGHKWMLGPEGAGIAYVRREWAERLRGTMVGWNSVVHALDFNKIELDLKPNAGKWEGGANNVPGITAMGASLQLLLEQGIENVWRQVESTTDYLCAQAPRAGLQVFSSRVPGEKSGIVSLIKPGADPVSLVKTCRAAGVIVNARHNRLRVSPHAYNTFEDVDRLLEALA